MIKNAIALDMISVPETIEEVMVMGEGIGLEVETRSKLRHAHVIQKRYLLAVGQFLLSLSQLPNTPLFSY